MSKKRGFPRFFAHFARFRAYPRLVAKGVNFGAIDWM